MDSENKVIANKTKNKNANDQLNQPVQSPQQQNGLDVNGKRKREDYENGKNNIKLDDMSIDEILTSMKQRVL